MLKIQKMKVGNMKVLMTKFEQLAVQHGKRYAKNWDYFCIAAGAYLEAWRESKKQDGTEIVEVVYEDGEHQLSPSTFNKWKQENDSLSLKDALKIYLPQFEFSDLRVYTDNEGKISFQGTCTRVKTDLLTEYETA